MNWLTQNWIWIVLGIGVLFLLRRTGCFGGMSHGQHGHGGDRQDHGDHSSHSTEVTTATDPVTGKEVPTAQAITCVYRGRVYYFETQESRQRFEASPEQYAREAAGHSLPSAEAANRPHSRRHRGC